MTISIFPSVIKRNKSSIHSYHLFLHFLTNDLHSTSLADLIIDLKNADGGKLTVDFD